MGAGITGVCLAHALSGHGEDVVLLDAASPGASATSRNAGFLLTDSSCQSLQAAQVGPTAARALRAAGQRTREIVRGLASRTDLDLELAWTGSVRLASDHEEARHFALTAAADLPGVHLEALDSVPEAGAAPGWVAALADDGDGQVHPLRLLSAFLDEVDRRGVRRFDGTPVRAVRSVAGGGIVETSDGRVHAEHVVVATNSEARLLLGPLARPIRPVRAQVLVAEVTPVPPWRRPVYATRGADYWRLLPDGRVLVGGRRSLDVRRGNTRSAAPTAAVQRGIEHLLRSLLPSATRIRVTRRWGGTMAFTPTHLPWAGPLAGRPHVSILAGMNGHGMGWAPGLAAALADGLTGHGPGPPPCLRPGLRPA